MPAPGRSVDPTDDDARALLERWESHREAAPDERDGPGSTGVPGRRARLLPPGSVEEEDPTDYVAAGRHVLDGLGIEPAREEVDEAPVRPPYRAELGPSTDVEFSPRVAARRVVGLVAFVAVLVTGALAYRAYDDPTTENVVLAVVAGVVALVVWAVRASSPVTRLAIRTGQLEVRRDADRHVADLRNPHVPVEMRGRPGSLRWKVLIGRVGQAPLVIDRSMVDSRRFTEALLALRPDLAPPSKRSKR